MFGHFLLRGSVIAADKQIVIAGHARRLDHDIAIYGVERLHDARGGKRLLNPLAERIRIAKT